MPSLSPERLAALVDEPPTPEEQALLDASPALRAELAALRRVVAMAAHDRTHPGAPLTAWASLGAALRDEGLAPSRRTPVAGAIAVRDAAHGIAHDTHHLADAHDLAHEDTSVRSIAAARARRAAGRARAPWQRPWAMAAAAALLVVLGALGGRASMPTTIPVPPGATYEPAVAVVDDGAAPSPVDPAAPPPLAVAEYAAVPAAGSAPVGVAARGGSTRAAPGTLPPGALTVGARLTDREQAVRTLQQLEEAHQQAVGWLAANDSSVGTMRRIVSPEAMVRDLRRQIEVLDAAVAMGRRALYESPDDPVMNRYYFSALAAREVLLRKLAAALPAGQQVLEY